MVIVTRNHWTINDMAHVSFTRHLLHYNLNNVEQEEKELYLRIGVKTEKQVVFRPTTTNEQKTEKQRRYKATSTTYIRAPEL